MPFQKKANNIGQTINIDDDRFKDIVKDKKLTAKPIIMTTGTPYSIIHFLYYY